MLILKGQTRATTGGGGYSLPLPDDAGETRAIFTQEKKVKIAKGSCLLDNMVMTEAQRDYLADLALQKGVKVDASIARSPAWASKEIERLKALPDPKTEPADEKSRNKFLREIEAIKKEIDKWTLE